jgi:hypothetical protein
MTDIMIPFCIHYRSVSDSRSSASRSSGNNSESMGFIGYPSMSETLGGGNMLYCDRHLQEGDWELYSKFTAVNPIIGVKPPGMSLIAAKMNPNPPHQTIEIDISLDPFSISPNTVYFFTYTRKIRGTKPLYIYRVSGNLVFTFKEFEDAERHHLSPLYVVKDPNTGFSVNMGRCIPSTHGTKLETCMAMVINSSLNKDAPRSILDLVSREDKKTNWGLTLITIVLMFSILTLFVVCK